jgi:hypothetical protein
MPSGDLLSGLRESNPSETFQEIYSDYLGQLAELDLTERAKRLGLTLLREGGGSSENSAPELGIPLFGRIYGLSPQGILPPSGERPLHAEAVLLSRYVLLAPQKPSPQKDWSAFRDFADAAPFAGAFATQVEKSLADTFSGRSEELERACSDLRGEDPNMGLAYTLCREFPALPCIRMVLLFNDADEEFPAEARILFPDNAAEYLDMECLAILGWLLKDLLSLSAGGKGLSLM